MNTKVLVVSCAEENWEVAFHSEPEMRVEVDGKLPTLERWYEVIAPTSKLVAIPIAVARALYIAAVHAARENSDFSAGVRAAADRLVEVTKERDAARADRESMHKDYLRVAGELSVTQRERDEAIRLSHQYRNERNALQLQEKLDAALAKGRDAARAELEKCRIIGRECVQGLNDQMDTLRAELKLERESAKRDRKEMSESGIELAKQRDEAQAEVKRLKDKLNTDSQHFEIQCLKAERDAFREKLDAALGPDKDQEAFVSAIGKERDAARAELEKCRRVVQCPPLGEGQSLSAYLEQWVTRCSQETEIGSLQAKIKRLNDLIDKTAAVFMEADRELGIPFEGAIDGAMKAVCDEVQRLKHDIRGYGAIMARDQKALRNAGFEIVNGSGGLAWKPPLAGGEEQRLRVKVEDLTRQLEYIIKDCRTLVPDYKTDGAKHTEHVVAALNHVIAARDEARARADMRLKAYNAMEVDRNKYKDELERHIRLLYECVNERDNYRKRKDEAYTERNRVVAAFARLVLTMGWPVAVTRTAIEGWSEDWHGCIFIGTPYGQVSWHFHDSHAYLFERLPSGPATWDGHSTPEKYARLEKLVATSLAVPVRPIKVKLPDVHDSCREGWAPAIEACAAAIRAAGGEVVS